jgi:hypothetical protein
MHGSGGSRGWLIHLAAGMALGAVIVLVAWIAAGGQPFGRIISSGDVSEPTTAAAARPTVEQRAVSTAVRLGSRPPELAQAPELRFAKPKAAKAKPAKATRRHARTVKPKRDTRPKRTRRSPVVRVVAPPEQTEQAAGDAPVAALPEAAPTAQPKPAAPAPVSGAGGGSAKPSPPDPVYWVGEG